MRPTRRQFLRLAGGAAVIGASGGLGLIQLGPRPQTGNLVRSLIPMPRPYEVALPIPATARPTGTAAGAELYDIVERAVDVEIIPGYTTRIWGYDGTFPGPTIRARRDRPVRVRVRNELDVNTVVHLHGGRTPAGSDGFPTDHILPGSWRDYDYPLQQRAATLWYHDHTMDFTGPNVYQGLAGFFILDDDEDTALALPRGEREIPLLICDRAFDRDGGFRYPARSTAQHHPGVEHRYMAGVLGDVVLVNGAAWPHHSVPRTRHRLRILNASNARRYELALDPPPPGVTAFVQIGTDGGLLEAPLHRTSLTLASAERADVIVDFGAYPAGTRVELVNLLGDGSTRRIMRFDIGDTADDPSTIPDRLSEHEPLHRQDAAATRTFAFRLGRVESRAPGTGTSAGNGVNGNGAGGLHWTINGRTFDPDSDDATVRLGDVEVWRFMTDLHHPIHLHLVHFKVLNRNGHDPADSDLGWKDTIDLIPGETAEVIARFDGFPGRYVFHCHNLEHEDMMMMANVRVVEV